MTNERFIRWQGYTLQQAGFVNNLLLGLATGVMGFVISLLFFRGVDVSRIQAILLGVALLSEGGSIVLGSLLAWNRYDDFRVTANIAKDSEDSDVEGLRAEARTLGKTTKKLLWWQVRTFWIGLAFLVGAALGEVCRIFFCQQQA